MSSQRPHAGHWMKCSRSSCGSPPSRLPMIFLRAMDLERRRARLGFIGRAFRCRAAGVEPKFAVRRHTRLLP